MIKLNNIKCQQQIIMECVRICRRVRYWQVLHTPIVKLNSLLIQFLKTLKITIVNQIGLTTNSIIAV